MPDFDVIDGWRDELEKMNEGKEGVHHSGTLTLFCTAAGELHAGLFPPAVQTQTTVGVVKAHAKKEGVCLLSPTTAPHSM